MPYKPWNGVGSSTNWQSTSRFGGYCTHSSILFLTWHRPYLALYEVGVLRCNSHRTFEMLTVRSNLCTTPSRRLRSSSLRVPFGTGMSRRLGPSEPLTSTGRANRRGEHPPSPARSPLPTFRSSMSTAEPSRSPIRCTGSPSIR
jgi:hypothetical protein